MVQKGACRWNAEGRKRNAENREKTLVNVIVPQPAVWEIDGQGELEGYEWCEMVDAKR